MRFGPNMTGDNTDTAIGVVMAPRDSSFARETVAGNLGLTADDLGVSDNDGLGLPGFEGAGDDDQGGNDDGQGEIDFGEGGRGAGGQQDDEPNMGERPVRRARDQFGREPQARRQQQQDQQRQPQLPPTAGVRADQRGNLVDNNGQIVARAGKEARLYQIAINTTREYQRLQGEHQTRVGDLGNRLNRAVSIGTELDRRVKEFEARDAEVRRLGITPQEQTQANQLIARSKTDPIGALKFILTQAAANGIDLTQLGMQNGADFKVLGEVIRNELQNGMQPLRERTAADSRQEKERKAQEQEKSEAEDHVRQFFTRNRSALPFVPVFEKVLQSHPGMPLDAVWARIQLNVERQQWQQQQNPRTRVRHGAPNGRGQPPSQNNNRGRMAPVTQSYEDVTRSVLDEMGIK